MQIYSNISAISNIPLASIPDRVMLKPMSVALSAAEDTNCSVKFLEEPLNSGSIIVVLLKSEQYLRVEKALV